MMLCSQLRCTPKAYSGRFPLDSKDRPLWNSTRNPGKPFQTPYENGSCTSVDVFQKKDDKSKFALACTQCEKNFKGKLGSKEYHDKVFKLVVSPENLFMVNATKDGIEHTTEEQLYSSRNFLYNKRWTGENQLHVGKCADNNQTSGVGNNVLGYYGHWLSTHFDDKTEISSIVQRAMEIQNSSKIKAFTDTQPISRKKKRGDSLTAPIPGEAKLREEELL